MKRPDLRLPVSLRARSGSSFDSRVERDHKDAEAKRKQSRVTAILRTLVLSDGNSYAKQEEAAAGLKELWPTNPQDASGRNDLAVAFAWLRWWDEALAEIGESVTAAKDMAAKEADQTKKVITDAVRAEVAELPEIEEAIEAGTGDQAAKKRSMALKAIEEASGTVAKRKLTEIDKAIEAAARARAVKDRSDENGKYIRQAREAFG